MKTIQKTHLLPLILGFRVPPVRRKRWLLPTTAVFGIPIHYQKKPKGLMGSSDLAIKVMKANEEV